MKNNNLQSTLVELELLFKRFNIRTDQVGFYDDDTFLSAERLSSTFLENYAAYVQLKKYPEDYITKAIREVPFIAKILHEELVEDGRLGACIDASIVLSRILEKEGFWNHIVKGSLTIKFPSEAKLEDRYFWSVDLGEFAAAHAWIVVPPFNVIDITIQQQPFSNSVGLWLPPYLFQSEYCACEIEEYDVISPDYRLLMKRDGIKGKLLPHIKNNWNKFVSVFKPNLITHGDLSLKYIPVAIAAPDKPLESVGTLNLSGRKGLDIYNDLIVPKLKEFRKM